MTIYSLERLIPKDSESAFVGVYLRDRRLNRSFRFVSGKPDGTMQKLLDVSLLNSRGWKATTSLEEDFRVAYRLFLEEQEVFFEVGG